MDSASSSQVRTQGKYYRSQHIAYWFLRLNGFFTITNFIIHPALRHGSAQTDGDILGVRFPHRAELREFGDALEDDALFATAEGRIDFVIAEVKRGRCDVNRAWTEPDRRVIQYALNAVGLLGEEQIEAAAKEMYDRGSHDNGSRRLRLFAFGSERDDALHAVQVLWVDALGFIYRRFWEHRRRKSDHDQWGELGSALFDHVTSYFDEERKFVDDAMRRLI